MKFSHKENEGVSYHSATIGEEGHITYPTSLRKCCPDLNEGPKSSYATGEVRATGLG